MPLIDLPPKLGFAEFMRAVVEVPGVDAERVRVEALRTVRYLQATPAQQAALPPPHPLQDVWYEGLAAGDPAWAVYDADSYLAELWGCWAVYSRSYLRNLRSKGLMASFGSPARIADLGCGFGFTAASWAELFPASSVVATNIEGTKQWALAYRVAQRYRFHLVTELTAPAEVVFASEYFEHIPAPIAHLRDVLDAADPSVLIAANAFGARSTGHFDSYEVDGEQVTGKRTAEAFAALMRARGYVKLKTGMWNERPQVWRRG